jgi:hypothetical protein
VNSWVVNVTGNVRGNMEEKFRLFVEKAGKIVADLPIYAREEDKIALLNRKFRLGRKEAEVLLDAVRKG